MVERISLYEKKDTGSTKVSNCFIDHFMTDANEAQIKIYLYLLRAVSSGTDISVSDIADRFNYTERDILRSLIYWDSRGLISLDFDDNKIVRGIGLNPNPVVKTVSQGSVTSVSGFDKEPYPAQQKSITPARPFYSSGQIQDFKDNEEVRDLLFTTEQYLKRSLSSSDLSSILYIYDSLHFDADLICFLVEYCVNSNHKNMHYIESVAMDWNERGIRSIEDARADMENRREYYDVLKAFGLSGRNPVKSDIDFIRRWKDEYGFSSELILEAVHRTMSSISKPSFQYADSILKSWREKKVSALSDLEAADRGHFAETRENSGNTRKVRNFKERDIDFSELEKKFARN